MQHRGETVQFRIPADPQSVALVRRAVESVASSLGFSDENAADIELSVAEAVTNAVEHGSRQLGHPIVVACKVVDGKMIIDVRDDGRGFEMTSHVPEWFSENGRGLRLIYELMDNVHIRCTEKGALIRMIKEMPPPASIRRRKIIA
jgi:serine/threonine-protein kinase RsbW